MGCCISRRCLHIAWLMDPWLLLTVLHQQNRSCSGLRFRPPGIAEPRKWAEAGPTASFQNLTGEPLQRGFAAYGSDSGHQNPPAGPRGAAPNPAATDWWSNDEAVRNFGYMQMKKTHDAAMIIVERMYGERPRFNYYIGNSQGGRESIDCRATISADYDKCCDRSCRQSFIVETGAAPYTTSREATGELGDSSQSKRSSRGVHAPM